MPAAANGNILTDPAATFAGYDIFDPKTDEAGSERTDAECAEWVGAEWPTEIDAALIKINRWLVGSESAGIAGNTTTLLGNFALTQASATCAIGDGSGSPAHHVISDDASNGIIYFFKDSATAGTNDKRIVHAGTGDYALKIQNYSGGWVQAFTVTNASNVEIANDLKISGDLDHDGSNVGFYGTAPAAKPTITGSRGGNAALADLLTELATLGLITDSSSA